MIATTESLIQKTPGVIGGAACIRRTRIAVYMLVRYRQLGVSDDVLLTYYPDSITRDDLAAAWAYYETHHEEIEARIREDEEDDDGCESV